MQRIVRTAVVAALVVLSSAAATAAASAPRIQLRQFSCEQAVSPIARTISVWSWMRPVPGTRKLEARWVLLSRPTTGGTFTVVPGTGLGTWVSPTNRTLGQRSGDVWKLHKSVSDLSAPAVYKLRGTFRWLGTGGRVLATMKRSTHKCAQPELRPDLLVRSIAVQPIPRRPAFNRYVATIANAGKSAAGPFEVQFSPGGGLSDTIRSETGLAAHHQLQETFVGPACTTTSPVTVTVDPTGAVDDFNRSNNQLTAVCPAPTAA
jgi:hypothetical protein